MRKVNLLLLKKIKSRGLFWFFARLLYETNRPISKTMKIIRPIILLIYWLFLYPINKLKYLALTTENTLKDKLYLFYDLEVSPITYDFGWALAVADHRRKKLGLAGVQVVFVPGRNDGLREEAPDYEVHVDCFARHWRKYTILHALTALFPTCVGVTFCASRAEASILCEQARPNILPERYSVTFPIPHSNFNALTNEYPLMSLRSTKQALRYIQQWFSSRAKGRKLIVITLRQSTYMLARNSNIRAWAEFAKRLSADKYFIVFVPDTEKALEEVPNELKSFAYFTEPCWNIGLRAALYELSYLNLGVNNGPMGLCWLNPNCRYITFKMKVDTVPQASEGGLRIHGFKIGKSLPFANSFQKWVWRDDDEEVIWTEFEAMCLLLESTEEGEINQMDHCNEACTH